MRKRLKTIAWILAAATVGAQGSASSAMAPGQICPATADQLRALLNSLTETAHWDEEDILMRSFSGSKLTILDVIPVGVDSGWDRGTPLGVQYLLKGDAISYAGRFRRAFVGGGTTCTQDSCVWRPSTEASKLPEGALEDVELSYSSDGGGTNVRCDYH